MRDYNSNRLLRKLMRKDSLERTLVVVDMISMFMLLVELELTFVVKSLLLSSLSKVSQVAQD
jgi:hypothetical protein